MTNRDLRVRYAEKMTISCKAVLLILTGFVLYYPVEAK